MTGASPVRRVLVCDDSSAYARALARFLAHDPELEVVAICSSGEEALRELDRLEPDLVTMDLEMPGIGGVRATAEIMRVRPTPILIVSAHAAKGSDRVAEALAAGALEVLAKDGLRLDQIDDVWAQATRSRIKRLASVRLSTRPAGPASPSAAGTASVRRSARVIGVGASTGGPPALAALLGGLPSGFGVPVLVVQHIATSFTEGLVRWLDQQIELSVRIASDGIVAGPGVWFAPDDAHLLLRPSMRLALDATTPAKHRPSVDELFESIAETAGGSGVGVVLTGMGRDGASGSAAILSAGGLALAQDESTSAVYGMPQAAAQAGATILPIESIAGALRLMRVPESVTP